LQDVRPRDEEDRLEQLFAVQSNPRQSIRSIQILAAEHGFDDLTAFNAAFRERYGSSPVAIRKAAKDRLKVGRRRS
jgi:AraC-like DNA-binding protein